MRRAPLVIGGTIAGVAGVLAFPTHKARLVLPSSSASASAPQPSAPPPSTPAPSTTPTAAPSTASPSTTSPSTPTPAAPSTAAPSTAPTSAPATLRHATGAAEQYPFGVLSVTVTVEGSRITGVTLAEFRDRGGRSAMIDNYAIPLLRQQVLAADSTAINGVSGATYTSQAYVDSVQSALDKLGVK